MSHDVKKLAVVGAGVMGGEIACVAAAAGIPVVLKDIDQGCLDAGMEKARAIFAFRVKRRRMTQEEMDGKMGLIVPTLEAGPLGEADFVIEAVPEVLEVKQRVFADLETQAAPGALLASNTSALSITRIAELVREPGRVVGMHFFNPVSMMRLVEVIPGEKTSAETVERTRAAAEALGKAPVTVADRPGFIVNRLLCAAMLEALRCEREEVAERAVIDWVLVKPDAGLPIGLFKMADQLGIDLLAKVMHILEDGLGSRFEVPLEIKGLHAAGRLGVKTGGGFYDYPGEAGAVEPPAAETAALVTERILTAVHAEGRRLAEEKTATREDIDTAMQFGALFKKPPFAYEREVGEEAMRERLKEYAAKYGEPFRV